MEINFWTDTHAHIHDDEYGRSVDEFISLASDKNVKRIITIGIDYDDSIKQNSMIIYMLLLECTQNMQINI